MTDPTVPLRLSRAIEVWLPDSGLTVSALKSEAKKGRLVIERIAGKDCVTGEAIQRMRQLCRVEARERFSTSSGKRAGHPIGSSEMADAQEALDAALLIAQELRKPLRATSSETSSRTPAKVIRPRFKSRRS